MMDGSDYAAAKRKHENTVDLSSVKQELEALREHGVVYFRDGGDAFGVGKAARAFAEEYGIEYATPVFAIHKKGRYGWIVGRAYETIADFRQRILEAKEERADFIKLIVSGIITFQNYGELSCPSLPAEEIRELIHIVHEEGFSVMIHVNGAEAIRACVEAGADSIEHGYFADEETLACIAEHDTIWVPTLAATQAFVGREGFDEAVSSRTVEGQIRAIRYVTDLCRQRQMVSQREPSPLAPARWCIAAGSDSGAVGVPHGAGAEQEYSLLAQAGLNTDMIENANMALREKFRVRRHLF